MKERCKLEGKNWIEEFPKFGFRFQVREAQRYMLAAKPENKALVASLPPDTGVRGMLLAIKPTKDASETKTTRVSHLEDSGIDAEEVPSNPPEDFVVAEKPAGLLPSGNDEIEQLRFLNEELRGKVERLTKETEKYDEENQQLWDKVQDLTGKVAELERVLEFMYCDLISPHRNGEKILTPA